VDTYGNSTPYVFRWTETNGSCADYGEISIYFWEPTVSDAGADIELCGPSQVLDADDPVIGTGTWAIISQPGGSTVEFGPGNSEINNFDANATVDVYGIYEFQWQVTNGICTAADIVQVIYREPVIVTTGGDQFIAAGTATTPLGGVISGSATNGSWSVSSGIPGGTFTPDPTNLDAIFDPIPAQEADGSVTLRLTSDDPFGVCPAVWEEIIITIGPNPEVYITSPANGSQFCADEVISLDGTYDGSATEATWSADNGAGRSISTGTFSQDLFSMGPGPQSFTTVYTPSVADTAAGSVTIFLTSDDPPPAGPPITAAETSITIFLNPIPTTTPIAGDIEACVNETKIYRVDGVSGSPLSTYSWTISPLDGNEPVLITGLGNVALLEYGPDPWSGTISVEETSLGCTGPLVTLDVDAFSAPVAIAGPDQTVCSEESVTLGGSPSATGGSGSYIYNWAPAIDIDDPSIANPTVTIFNATLVQISRTYLLTVIDAATGCISASDIVTVFVDPVPEIANNLDKTVCSHLPVNVILDVESALVPVSGYTIVSVTPDPLLNVLSTTSPGSGYPDNVIANDTYRNTTLNPLNVVYTVIGEGTTGCNSDPKDITVTINPEPMLDPTLVTSICSGEATNIVLTTLPGSVAAFTYEVSVNFQHPDIVGTPTTGIGTNDIIMNDIFTNTSSTQQFIIYDVIPSSAIGCEGDVDQVFVYVAPEMTASLSSLPDEICLGDFTDITFNLTGNGPFDVTYTDGTNNYVLTDISDGHQITLTPDTTTTYSLVSVFDNSTPGCSPADISSEVEIIVNELPTAQLVTDTLYLCEGSEVDLEISLTGDGPYELTYEDNSGNNYVDIIYQDDAVINHSPSLGTTTYTLLSVTDSNSPVCEGTVSGSLTAVVNELPTGYISVGGATSGNSSVEICEGDSVDVTFTLTGVAPWSIEYEINMGTVTTINNIMNPVHVINVKPAETTRYTLIKVSDGSMAACDGTVSGRAEIIVHETPDAEFNAEPLAGCAPLDVNFDNFSAGNLSGANTGYYYREQGDPAYTLMSHDLFTSFTFGNNSSSTKYFDVMFIAETPAGCADSTVKVLTVDPGILLDITTDVPFDGCTPHTVTFNNNNAIPATYYVWQWGDGEPDDTTTTEPTISHMFINSSTNSAKTYTVSVTGVNPDSGCEETSVHSVRVNPDISIRITSDIDEGCAPLLVTFTNNSSGVSDHTWFYRPKGSDGQEELLNSSNASFEFPNRTQDAITYEVIYIAKNRFDCEESDTLEVLVWPELVPDFTVDPLIQTLPESSVTIADSTNEGPWDYYWDLGDGNSSADPNLTEYTYETYGIYAVTLEVSYGPCTEIHTETTVIEPISPIIDFTADVREGCRPLTVNFTNLSQFADPDSYYWDFGDGRGWSKEVNPSYTYYNPGSYTVTLEATNELGIVIKEIKEFYIDVWDVPFAQFNVRPHLVYVPDEPVYTSNLSIGGVEWYWDFGDGIGTSTEYEPTYTYTYPGIYDIFLWVANEYGCEDSLLIEKAVIAEEGGIVATPNVFTPNPDGPGGSGGGIGNPAFNDVFLPQEKGVIEFHLQIFNRWGEMLFESYDKNVGWDGYYRGRLSPADVYVYKLDLKLNDGNRVTRLGDVFLLR
jgi:gliding motility-associated-like protein